jgi:hypothetical protein
VVDGPEAASAFVDDPVPARSRSWVDAYDFHGNTLGRASDAPASRLHFWRWWNISAHTNFN